MRAALLFAVALFTAALGPSTTVLAQSVSTPQQDFADPACPKLSEVEAVLERNHNVFVVLNTHDLLGVDDKVSNQILVTTIGNDKTGIVSTIGYVDANGCVNGPTMMSKVSDPKTGA